MTETSTTTDTAATAAVVAHGLMALGLHMATHDLPLYADIETPANGQPLDHIIIQLGLDSMLPWLNSVEIDERRERRYGQAVEVHAIGRLPDTGVRVDLYYLDFTSAAVPA